MSVEPRSSWSTRQMTCPDRIQSSYAAGAGVHWPGEKGLTTLGLSHAGCHQRYKGIENYQMDVSPEDYGAIAYQVLVCNPHGILTVGRGVGKLNGANGDGPSNIKYGSILALIGMGEKPTPQLLRGILAAREYLRSGKVLKTHNDIRPEATACPGPALTAWIKAGYPAPEEDVALSKADIQAIAKAVVDETERREYANLVNGAEMSTINYLQRIHKNTAPEVKP